MYSLLVRLFPSSVNSAELSLTVRGLGVYIIPFLIWYFQIDEATASELFNGIVKLIDTVSAVVATCMVIVGILRKIWK